MPVPHLKARREYFDSYRGLNSSRQRWCAPLELAVVHQHYDGGGDTGHNRHEDFYALYIVQGGRGIHMINGHPYSIARGDVYLTPPGTAHAYRDYFNLRAEAFCFQAEFFTDEELDALRSLPGFWQLMVPLEAEGEFRNYHLHLSPERHREVEAMLSELLRELEEPRDQVSPLLGHNLFFRLMVYLARQHETRRETKTSNNASTRHAPALADVLRYCEARFAEPLSVPQLAAMMFLSPARFSEVFAREVGMPPAAYIRHLRLEHAQMLLRTTNVSVTKIAHRSGFGDSAQFSRAFRHALNTTPRDYRARYKQHNREKMQQD